MRDTSEPQRPHTDPPIIVVRVDHADATHIENPLFDSILKFLSELPGITEIFSKWGLESDRQVTVASSKDGRALAMAGLFLQFLDQEGIDHAFETSQDLDPIPNLREMIRGDLSSSVCVRTWSALPPLGPLHAGSIHFFRLVELLREFINDLLEAKDPIVIFTHEGFGPVISYLVAANRLRELPPDPPMGKVLCILDNGVRNLPSSPASGM